MSELLRELQEDIRAERMQRLWDRFGKTLVKVSIAVLLGTVIGVGWQHYRQSQATERTSVLINGADLLRAGNYQGAMDALAGLKGNFVHADMAALQRAVALEAMENLEAAQEIYRALAARSGQNAYTDLAGLLVARETDPPMAAQAESVFAHLHKERRAWQLLQAGQRDEAVAVFVELQDAAAAPRSLRARASAALSVLAPVSATAQAAENGQ